MEGAGTLDAPGQVRGLTASEDRFSRARRHEEGGLLYLYGQAEPGGVQPGGHGRGLGPVPGEKGGRIGRHSGCLQGSQQGGRAEVPGSPGAGRI